MSDSDKNIRYKSIREKFLSLSPESTRKSDYPQLKKQLEVAKENERLLQLLIDNGPARISYVDAEERYVFVNREYEKTFGLKRDQIIGRRVETILGYDNYIIGEEAVEPIEPVEELPTGDEKVAEGREAGTGEFCMYFHMPEFQKP
jgi:PAS domain S-box-containing protein